MSRDVHDDEDGADDDALHTAAEDRVRDDGQRLVHDHVREQQRDEEEVPVLADGLDLVRILLLFPVLPRPGRVVGISAIVVRAYTRVHSRRSAHAEHVQLRLVETHVSQRQTGKQTRGQDKDGYEADEYVELGVMLDAIPLGKHMQRLSMTGVSSRCCGVVAGKNGE